MRRLEGGGAAPMGGPHSPQVWENTHVIDAPKRASHGRSEPTAARRMGGAFEARSLSDDLFGPDLAILGGSSGMGAHPTLAEAVHVHAGHSGNKLQYANPAPGSARASVVEGMARDAQAWQAWGGSRLPDASLDEALGDPFSAHMGGLGKSARSSGADGGASSGGRVGAQSGESSGKSGEAGGGEGRGQKPASPPAATSKSFKEIHAERNKQAQRRFRQRQKVCHGFTRGHT